MSYEKCKERPAPDSEHRCTRAAGHKGDHVDSKVGRFAWKNESGEA